MPHGLGRPLTAWPYTNNWKPWPFSCSLTACYKPPGPRRGLAFTGRWILQKSIRALPHQGLALDMSHSTLTGQNVDEQKQADFRHSPEEHTSQSLLAASILTPPPGHLSPTPSQSQANKRRSVTHRHKLSDAPPRRQGSVEWSSESFPPERLKIKSSGVCKMLNPRPRGKP